MKNFTNLKSESILRLEEEIAYFYGLENPELVKKYYIEAIKLFEETLSQTTDISIVKQSVIPYLEKAYEEIKIQTGLLFNIKTAAEFEFGLILAQAEKESFEKICQIMVDLYQEVFQLESKYIKEAAILRTFLYKYKIELLGKSAEFQDMDIKLLQEIAAASEQKLAHIYK